MRSIIVPPIKSQGIKTALVPWIESIIPKDFSGRWIEPFMGTGVVGFNVAPVTALMSDTNPHMIAFYAAIANQSTTSQIVREYLTREGKLLEQLGESHFYFIRERFNAEHNPLDFLFVNRAGFNGMIRFNRKGEYNIPFCRKPNRFAQSYITKIYNQVAKLETVLNSKQIVFKCQDFLDTIDEATSLDIIYCDPPYIERHVDYYNGWDGGSETRLKNALANFEGQFILSTWHHNDYRENRYISALWSDFNIITRDHFYHVGGREENRNPMVEALITNFKPVVKENRGRTLEHVQAVGLPLFT